MPGRPTSLTAEVDTISSDGIKLRVDGRELFMPYDGFPWFREAPPDAIRNVLRPQPDHLYWPDLDVDLSLDSIEHPERYPLRAR
jgi:hypothetical protein